MRRWKSSIGSCATGAQRSNPMDPHLIDLVWEVQREAGTKQPIEVVCGYRSPETNAMLRRRSRGVARFSQHMLGHAMDFYIPGVPLEELRESGLRLAARRRRLLPDLRLAVRPHGHRQRAHVAAHDARTNWRASSPTAAPCRSRATASRCPAMRSRSPTSRSAATAVATNSLEAARTAGIDVGTVVASDEPSAANPFARLLGLKKDDDDEAAYADATAAGGSRAAARAAASKPSSPRVEHAAETRAARRVSRRRAEARPQRQLMRRPRAAGAGPLRRPSMRPRPRRPRRTRSSPRAATGRARRKRRRGAIAAKGARSHAKSPAPIPNTTGSIGPLPGALATIASHPNSRSPMPNSRAATRRRHAARAAAAAPHVARRRSHRRERHDDRGEGRHRSAKTSRQTRDAARRRRRSKSRARFDDPWLRAIVLSPSVHHFLTTLALGARDFRSLAALMVKPASSVMMTFSPIQSRSDADHFSGTAIVFISTVTYPERAPRRCSNSRRSCLRAPRRVASRSRRREHRQFGHGLLAPASRVMTRLGTADRPAND